MRTAARHAPKSSADNAHKLSVQPRNVDAYEQMSRGMRMAAEPAAEKRFARVPRFRVHDHRKAAPTEPRKKMKMAAM
jgi:hypothetical protein